MMLSIAAAPLAYQEGRLICQEIIIKRGQLLPSLLAIQSFFSKVIPQLLFSLEIVGIFSRQMDS